MFPSSSVYDDIYMPAEYLQYSITVVDGIVCSEKEIFNVN